MVVTNRSHLTKRKIDFTAEDGTVLRGYLYGSPNAPAPAIVMTHGFSGVIEQIDHYAAFFADQGFAVFLFDHRGFGISEGTPRQEIDPARQLADWRDAITFMLARPEVVAEAGVGIWGTSFAGGLALVLAANDRRIRCVVAQIPNVSGHRNGWRMFNTAERARLDQHFDADRVARLGGAEPATMPVFATEAGALCALPPVVSPRYVKAVETRFPTWRNVVTLRSVENMLSFEPAGWLPYVAPTPLMMIVAEKDSCTFPETQLEVFTAASEPKRLVIHPGGHFETYVEHFIQTSMTACEWFTVHLRKPLPS